MFEITPIAATSVDWHRFVDGANTAINRSPTRQLDLMKQDVGSLATYISALGEFQTKAANAEQTLRDPFFLRHVMISFLVGLERDTLFRVLTQNSDFAIIMTTPGRLKENFIITGNLAVWQAATLCACREDAPVELREFYNAIWLYLHKLGFREMFGQHRRRDLNDKTFVLEAKR